ncbi:MAG: InlB B-repeat-containing protein [Clostridia bacterium]|nr:InlB B-repeat-containing protein [Clostridia bacterium]
MKKIIAFAVILSCMCLVFCSCAFFQKPEDDDTRNGDIDDTENNDTEQTTPGPDVDKAESYTVTYNVNGGVMPEGAQTTVTVEGGKPISLPIPTREGHTFLGWYTGESVVDGLFTSANAVFSNLNLIARWRADRFIVTFVDHNGDTLDVQTVNWGESATAPDTVIFLNGKKLVFSEWDKDFSVVCENMTVKAIYVANNHTLTFSSDIAEQPNDIVLSYGDIADEPNILIPDGYTFCGWYLDDEFSERYYFNYPLNESTTLYANFYPNTNGEYSLITTAQDLENIQNNPTGKYLFTNNIDFEGGVWTPVSDFSGQIDGNGFKIINMTISVNEANGGFILNNTGTIKDLSFENITFGVSSTQKNDNYGVICANNSGLVSNCHLISGSISVANSYTWNDYSDDSTDSVKIGAIVGQNAGTVEYCSNTVDVSATVTAYNDNKSTLYRHVYVGGIVGYNDGDGKVFATVNKGKISLYVSVDRWSTNSTSCNVEARIGGAIGENRGVISESASAGDIEYAGNVISGNIYSRVGGFAGRSSGEIKDCYASGNIVRTGSSSTAYIGGFIGINNNIISNCYSTGNVNDNASGAANGVGGFAGLNETSDLSTTNSISKCFCTGNVVMQATANNYGFFVGKISNANHFGCYYLDSATITSGEEALNPESSVSQSISSEELLNVTFLAKDLYFDNGIWTLADGALPVLKALEN